MFNKVTAGALSVAAVLALVPATAFATTTPPTAAGSFCTNISSYTAKIRAHLTDVDTKVQGFVETRSEKKSDRWASQDQKLADLRSTADTNRANAYAKLDAKASTTEEQAAVATFKSTIDAAVATRRSAVDAAVQAYRDGIDAALTTFSTNLSAGRTTFESAVSAAEAKAQSDCAAGVAPQSVRQTLHDSVQAARDAFRSSRGDGTLHATQQQLAATRKSAIDAAIATYKSTAQQAAATLKAAFGK